MERRGRLVLHVLMLPQTVVAWGCIIYPVPCLVCNTPYKHSKSFQCSMAWRRMLCLSPFVSITFRNTILHYENNKSLVTLSLSTAMSVLNNVLIPALYRLYCSGYVAQAAPWWFGNNGWLFSEVGWKIILGNCKRTTKLSSNCIAATAVMGMCWFLQTTEIKNCAQLCFRP